MTNNDKVPELTNGEFNNFIEEGIVLIDFFAEWCMPCVMMSPIIDDLADEFEGKVKFGKVNIEDNQELANKFNVSSIPTFLILKDGEIVSQLAGAKTQDELSSEVRKHL
ncbi:thioredoxin [archaeon]|jgi:thioredoxin 1|nr:thioredoxin [archaeon]